MKVNFLPLCLGVILAVACTATVSDASVRRPITSPAPVPVTPSQPICTVASPISLDPASPDYCKPNLTLICPEGTLDVPKEDPRYCNPFCKKVCSSTTTTSSTSSVRRPPITTPVCRLECTSGSSQHLNPSGKPPSGSTPSEITWQGTLPKIETKGFMWTNTETDPNKIGMKKRQYSNDKRLNNKMQGPYTDPTAPRPAATSAPETEVDPLPATSQGDATIAKPEVITIPTGEDKKMLGL